ncbi:hypothetical protein H4S08_004460, partial [Coemansia sp. RSA 1365]
MTRVTLDLGKGIEVNTEFKVVPIAVPFILGILWMKMNNAANETKQACISIDFRGKQVRIQCAPPIWQHLIADIAAELNLITFEELEEVSDDDIKYIALLDHKDSDLHVCMLDDEDKSYTNDWRVKGRTEQLLSKYSDVFEEPPVGFLQKCTMDHQIVLAPNTCPIACTAYRRSPDKQAEIKRQVDALKAT